jgi:hypothetical protein
MNLEAKDLSTQAKNLTREAPRSPKVILGGFVILARAIDKCRAVLAGTEGGYEFNCELDNFLFRFKGILGKDLKKYIAQGHTDDEIVTWVVSQGTKRSQTEIDAWSTMMMNYDYSDNQENKEWLEGENEKLGLPKSGFLFDYLEADDKASFDSLN